MKSTLHLPDPLMRRVKIRDLWLEPAALDAGYRRFEPAGLNFQLLSE